MPGKEPTKIQSGKRPRKKPNPPKGGVAPKPAQRKSSRSNSGSAKKNPTTLFQYFSAPDADAAALVEVFASKKSPKPTKSDTERALAAVAESDVDLAKTRELARAVSAPGRLAVARALEPFLLKSVGSDLGVARSLGSARGEDAASVLVRALQERTGEFASEEPSPRLANALVIAILVLATCRRMSLPMAAPGIASILSLEGSRSINQESDLDGLSGLIGQPGVGIDQLRELFGIGSGWQVEIERLDSKLGIAEANCSELRNQVESQRGELITSREANEVLAADLERALDTVKSLEAKNEEQANVIQGTQHAKQHEGGQFRNSMSGFLDDEVLPVTEAVRDALKLEPPRVGFSLERLEDLEHAVKEKITWLTSSG